MIHLNPKNPETATGSHKQSFDQIHAAFGVIPNMFKTIGNSPAALEAMWNFFGALSKGKIDKKLSELIAVRVADLNRCEYCLAAHTYLGKSAGLSETELKSAQAGESANSRTQAALFFASQIVNNKAHLAAADFSDIRKAGFSDIEISEILAHVALNIFTNYTNVAFGVDIDFPKVALR